MRGRDDDVSTFSADRFQKSDISTRAGRKRGFRDIALKSIRFLCVYKLCVVGIERRECEENVFFSFYKTF